MSHNFCRLGCLALVLFCSSTELVHAQAKNRFKTNDEVIVRFLNDWLPAKVLQTNRRGEVMAAFQFAGATQQRTFKPIDVRFPHEKDALYQTRLWTSASGDFRVAAALIGLEKSVATLRKADMTEIKVPSTSLSGSDQRLLERLRRELEKNRPPNLAPKPNASNPNASNPIKLVAPTGPPVSEFSVAMPPASFDPAGDRPNPLAPDAAPRYLTLKQGGFGFAKASFDEQFGAILPLGGAGSLVLAMVEPQLHKSPTRLLWVNLEKQALEGQQGLPNGEVVIDYHPPSHRLLTFLNDNSLSQIQLTIWEVLPAEKEVKPLIRWKAPSRQVHEPWARIIDGNVVLQRISPQELVGWDVSAKRARYRINQESFFHPLPTLSAGRKQLFVCEDMQVRVYNAVTGQLLSTLPAPHGSSGVAVTRDGRRAAVLDRNSLAIWDLTNPSAGSGKIQAEAIGTPFSAKLHWVSNDRLLADNGPRGCILFGTKERMALWKYKFDPNAAIADQGRRLRAIVDDHLVYVAAIRAGVEQRLAVGAVALPGPKVEEVVAAVDRESLLLMKPGSRVRLQVQTDARFQPQVLRALQKQVAANQWTVDESAPAVLTATMSKGKSQTTVYQNMKTREKHTVTVTPFVSRLALKVNEQVAWQSGTSNGLPAMMRLKEGQTAQSEADRHQRPNPEFFEQVTIPPKITDPARRDGLGVTNVTTRGLEPVE